MKIIVPFCLIVLLPFLAPAQDRADKAVVALSAGEQPEYPGGEQALRRFLALNLHYPNKALEQKVEGELMVSFVIGEDGAVSDIGVRKGLGAGCDEEAIRVVGQMPAWHPAYVDGKPVKVTYMLPILFELPADQTQKKD